MTPILIWISLICQRLTPNDNIHDIVGYAKRNKRQTSKSFFTTGCRILWKPILEFYKSHECLPIFAIYQVINHCSSLLTLNTINVTSVSIISSMFAKNSERILFAIRIRNILSEIMHKLNANGVWGQGFCNC